MISLDYKDSRSLHEQIEDRIKELIVNEIMLPDEQLPSVRELSVSLTVNPNTVQRAYKELEQKGFIYSIKGKGNFVAKIQHSENGERIKELYSFLAATVKELMYLGEEKDGIENILHNIYAERRNEND